MGKNRDHAYRMVSSHRTTIGRGVSKVHREARQREDKKPLVDVTLACTCHFLAIIVDD